MGVVVHKQINAPINDLSGFASKLCFTFFFFISPCIIVLFNCLFSLIDGYLHPLRTYMQMICRYCLPVNAHYVMGAHYFVPGRVRGLNAMPVSAVAPDTATVNGNRGT